MHAAAVVRGGAAGRLAARVRGGERRHEAAGGALLRDGPDDGRRPHQAAVPPRARRLRGAHDRHRHRCQRLRLSLLSLLPVSVN